jgi:anti-sigma B factor antagonist
MSTPNVLKIDGELTIFRAAELKPALLAEPPVTEIDLSGVTDLDTAGVQLLMLAKKTAVTQGRDLHLTGHSAVVMDVFELLNLAAHFDDQMMMNSRTPAGGARS